MGGSTAPTFCIAPREMGGVGGGRQQRLFLSRTDCDSHKQVQSGGAVFQPYGSGATLVMKRAVRSKVSFMHEYVMRRRNAARANICVRSVAREAYGAFPRESCVSPPSVIRKNGSVDAVYGSAEKTWGRNYFENNAVLQRYGWMLSYIIESPAGCDAEKSDACAQRDSGVVKSATPEAFPVSPCWPWIKRCHNSLHTVELQKHRRDIYTNVTTAFPLKALGLQRSLAFQVNTNMGEGAQKSLNPKRKGRLWLATSSKTFDSQHFKGRFK